MKKGRPLAIVMLLLAAAGGARAGEIIDRIVVTVNGHAILLSDWDEALRYEALVNGKPLGSALETERSSVLQRLVDQELLRQQMEGLSYPHASPEEVQRQITTIRKELPGAATEEGWRARLGQYGFREEDFAARVRAQLDVLRFLDVRLRPSIHVDAASVETYYREIFLPAARQSGGSAVPLADVSSKIEELLAQQRMDEMLKQWLHDLREQSSIRESAAAGSAEAARLSVAA